MIAAKRPLESDVKWSCPGIFRAAAGTNIREMMGFDAPMLSPDR
jgi:hypothetical protein